MTIAFASPATGAVLVPDGPHALRDRDGRRWPIVDGIPFLRVGRPGLVDDALAALDRGDRDGALVVLLADQDDWWTGAAPTPDALRTLVARRDELGLGAAMALLAFDRVGDYFAHRWSDPTFQAGSMLIEAHWRPAAHAFELACGIGHYGRDLMGRGIVYTGADVVFAKLWLARHWVVGPDARLVCFDAAAPWPIASPGFDLVFCHDAFYFLEPKADILLRLRALRAPGGRLAVGHIHNRGADNLSAGRAVSRDDLVTFFPEATLYDDAELTRAAADGRQPCPACLDALADVEAFAVEDGPVTEREPMPDPRTATFRLNPLYVAEGGTLAVQWPSPRYAAEYGPAAPYPITLDDADSKALACIAGCETTPAALRHARFSRPDAGDTATFDRLARRRILVELPERW